MRVGLQGTVVVTIRIVAELANVGVRLLAIRPQDKQTTGATTTFENSHWYGALSNGQADSIPGAKITDQADAKLPSLRHDARNQRLLCDRR